MVNNRAYRVGKDDFIKYRVAQAALRKGYPVLVLNACQSDEEQAFSVDEMEEVVRLQAEQVCALDKLGISRIESCPLCRDFMSNRRPDCVLFICTVRRSGRM